MSKIKILFTLVNSMIALSSCKSVFAHYNQDISCLLISQIDNSKKNNLSDNYNETDDTANSSGSSDDFSIDSIPQDYRLPTDNELNGSIEHSANLEPVPDYLRAGAVYDEKTLKASITSSRIWYRIPNWLAGTWHQKYAIILKSTNTKLGKSRRKFIVEADLLMGREIDKNNNIWDTNIMPKFQNINEQNSEPVMVKVMTYYYKPEKYQESSYTNINKTRQIYINKSSGRIVKLRQSEGINTFTLVKPGVVRRISSIKWFDDSGAPLFEDKRLIYLDLKKDFKPIKISRWGENLYEDFIQYLKNNNLDDLIPN